MNYLLGNSHYSCNSKEMEQTISTNISCQWNGAGLDPEGGLGGYPPPPFGLFRLEIKKGNKTTTEAILSRIVPISLCQVSHNPRPLQKFWICHCGTTSHKVKRKTCCENLLFTEVMEHPPVFCWCCKPFWVSWTNVDIYGIKIIVFLMTCWHKQNTVININVYLFCTLFSHKLFEFMKKELHM